METSEELQAFLNEMVQPDLWGQLIARGSAWSLMRQDGVLPQGSPPFGATIETDLAEHAFSVLRGALALRELGEDQDLARRAFERAANAFEALIRNADIAAAERGFYRTIAAAAYHLASYSAIAYSLFSDREAELNTTAGEDALALLILRDLGSLRAFVRRWLRDDDHSDAAISAGLAEGTLDADDAVQLIPQHVDLPGSGVLRFRLADRRRRVCRHSG